MYIELNKLNYVQFEIVLEGDLLRFEQYLIACCEYRELFSALL